MWSQIAAIQTAWRWSMALPTSLQALGPWHAPSPLASWRAPVGRGAAHGVEQGPTRAFRGCRKRRNRAGFGVLQRLLQPVASRAALLDLRLPIEAAHLSVSLLSECKCGLRWVKADRSCELAAPRPAAVGPAASTTPTRRRAAPRFTCGARCAPAASYPTGQRSEGDLASGDGCGRRWLAHCARVRDC